MADKPKDESKDRRNLRVVSAEDKQIELPPDVDEVEILVRRIDKKLEEQNKGDLPWVRRIVGFLIIGAAFYFGWKMLDDRAQDLAKHTKPPGLSPVGESPGTTKSDSILDQSSPAMATLEEVTPLAPAPLDAATVTMISECTKGVNAFRMLDLDREKTTKGEATLESIFQPVFLEKAGSVRRTKLLQNVRIRAKNGEEWRLHASPQKQNGALSLQLFRVANDGLPEKIQFPDELKDLENAPLTDEAVKRFLGEAQVPGRAIEIERHEAWSYPDRAGAQLIWSDDMIFDIQVFMRDRFLACNRGLKAGAPQVLCKCVSHGVSHGRGTNSTDSINRDAR